MIHVGKKKIWKGGKLVRIDDVITPWDGGSGEKPGEWTIENVHTCRRDLYELWLEKFKRSIEDIVDKDLVYTPYPNIEKCKEANRLADARLEEARLKGPIPRPGARKENKKPMGVKRKPRSFAYSSVDDPNSRYMGCEGAVPGR
jgi:hypothetical protein